VAVAGAFTVSDAVALANKGLKDRLAILISIENMEEAMK